MKYLINSHNQYSSQSPVKPTAPRRKMFLFRLSDSRRILMPFRLPAPQQISPLFRKPAFARLFILALILALTSCNPYGADTFREMVVVESYLIADRHLPIVRLSKTLPIDQHYSFEAAAISGAEVTITLQPVTSQDEPVVFSYHSVGPGLYRADNTGHRVLPGRRYQLDVTGIQGHGPLQAATTVPAAFEFLGTIPSQLQYQGPQLEVSISPNDNPGRQNTYVFTTITENPVEENLTPFYAEFFGDDDLELADLAKNDSGLINEENFEVNPDGSVDLVFPWIAVAFYGYNQIVANSLDTNTTDFIRSQDVQLGGSTLSPGEIPNAIYHIDGGIGLFGSLSADTIAVNFVR